MSAWPSGAGGGDAESGGESANPGASRSGPRPGATGTKRAATDVHMQVPAPAGGSESKKTHAQTYSLHMVYTFFLLYTPIFNCEFFI